MINHKNYEIWFLDFAEGNLSERQIELLMDFLAKNRELQAEFDEMELIELPTDDTIVFDNKEMLKHPLTVDINLSSIDKMLIGELENDLTASEVVQLQKQLVARPALVKDQAIYQKSLLAPDLSVKYPNKNELKHKSRKVFPMRLLVQIAAAILFLVVMVFALRKGESAKSVELPIVQTPTEEKYIQPSQENENIQPEIVQENLVVPKQIIEQAIVPLPKVKQVYKKAIVETKEKRNPVILERVIQESIVNQAPKSPKPEQPQMHSPPKPQLEPELPDPKPVIAFKEPENKDIESISVEQNSSERQLIALNEPKEFLLKIVDKGVKKMVKKEDAIERISVPEAIISTVGVMTKTKTSYSNSKTKNAKRVAVSIGRFKFSRVKHGSR